MSRGPDAATLLERALVASAEAIGSVTIVESEWVRWASATFTGARHMITLVSSASPAMVAWVAGLTEAEFALRGHLVADLVVRRVHRAGDAIRIELEALTVEER